MVNLTTLAPDLVAAVLDDTLPPEVTLIELAAERGAPAPGPQDTRHLRPWRHNGYGYGGLFGKLRSRSEGCSLQGAPMTGPIVFIVSEDPLVRQSIKALVESAGLQAATFPTLPALLDGQEPQSRLCLVFYPETNTLDVPAQQARLVAACAGRSGILLIERGNIPTAVLALQTGVRDVAQKPYRDKELLERIVKVLEANART